MPESCPVCKTELSDSIAPRGNRYFFNCPQCGEYSLSGTSITILPEAVRGKSHGAAILSHALSKLTEREPGCLITSDLLSSILETAVLPHPGEQLDSLLIWLGRSQHSPGHAVTVTSRTQAVVGAADKASLAFICKYAIKLSLVEGEVAALVTSNPIIFPLRLSLQGWERFAELQRGVSSSRVAFMAMQFGNNELDKIYRDCFVPAVAATGFRLKRLDEGQPAGLIDDRLRVEIRQASFLIADLTHQNRGAYWEAGFAEGLGKPVIYTCHTEAFKDAGTHFDTNHHLTVLWSPDNEVKAAEKLKATIRATLPESAKLSD